MATGRIVTLFEDKEETKGVFPRTKTSAISNSNNVGLDALLLSGVCVGDDVDESSQSLPLEWLTPALTDEFDAYSLTGESQAPCYTKKNGVVHICGAVRPTSAIPATHDDHVIFTLPEGYRPIRNIAYRCHGSGVNTWCCTVKTDGTVNFARYGVTEYINAPDTAWLAMAITFIAA